MRHRLIACLLTGFVSTSAQADTWITADRMLDVENGRYVDDPVIRADEGGRIVSIDSGGSVPAGQEHIDFAGHTLMPGLIDMHVHLDGSPRYGGYSGLQFTDNLWPIVGATNAEAMLRAGFTTVRNLGASDYNAVAIKQAVEEGWVEGPRIVPAGHSLGATGGHCDATYFPPSFEAKSPAIGDGPQQLRQRVREQRKNGAEVIKVCATGGVFSRNTEPGQQQLSEDELRAVAEEARMWGLKSAAHAHGAAGIKAAIRAGIDTIEHASLVDEDGIRLARDRGTYFAMDIFNTEYTQAEGAKNGVAEDNLRKDREIAQIQRDNFRRAHEAGVQMVFASDAGVMPHDMAGGQFRIMVDYGMTPLEAIQAATVTAAEALGQGDDIGRIAVGYFADMIAVDGDPLAEITELEDVDAVVKGGQLILAN
ncbi:MAG: amidohydrolase family protein [Pacificimonas sp.]